MGCKYKTSLWHLKGFPDGSSSSDIGSSQARTGRGEYYFPCSADHDRDWQPYPVDPYSVICDDHTYIYIHHTLPS